MQIDVSEVQYVKELYPRARENDAIIERYRGCLENLPPIIIARGCVLVDGFHRWQAHRREGAKTIQAEDLGNLTDIEIFRESIRRNSTHGFQLEEKDKERDASIMWEKLAFLDVGERYKELCTLFSVSRSTMERWTKETRKTEKEEKQTKAWDMWLNCVSERQIAETLRVDHVTISNWLVKKRQMTEFHQVPSSLQCFDVWGFEHVDKSAGGKIFERMPSQVMENLLWMITDVGSIVVDPMAGSGTTIDVAKRMGRRVWASDLTLFTPNLPIHEHDITTGWPKDAPNKADLIILHPSRWKHGNGKYSEKPEDFGNMGLDSCRKSWRCVINACKDHLSPAGFIAFLIGYKDEDDDDLDQGFETYSECLERGLKLYQRIIVVGEPEPATPERIESAKENKRLLSAYSELIIMRAT